MDNFRKVIRSCHCTCIAGMGETCNHVVAVICKQQFAPVQQIPHVPVLQMNGSHAEEILNLEELKNQTLIEKILHSVIKRKDHL